MGAVNYRSFVLLLIDHNMNVDLTLRRRPVPLLNALIYILYPEGLHYNCSEKFREVTRKTPAMEFFFRNVEKEFRGNLVKSPDFIYLLFNPSKT